MAKRRVLSNNQILLILTIPITIGSVVTILSFLLTTGLVGGLESDIRSLSDQVNQQPALEDFIAQLPVEETIDPVGTNVTSKVVIGEPEGFRSSDQDLISAFLDAIGIKVTETFAIKSNVVLIDSDFEEQIESSLVKVQPLDPREVLLSETPEIDDLRFFINTDFSRQISDNGLNHHKFTGWDVVKDSGNFAGVPIIVTTTTNCANIPNTGLCVQSIGSKSDDDDTANNSVIYGVSKKIDISDWTREGDLTLAFDWDCNPNFRRSTTSLEVKIQGEFFFKDSVTTCNGLEKYTKELSEVAGNSNDLTVQIGVKVGNPDKFRVDYKYNNIQLLGNSVIKRIAQETIGLIDTFSIIQNNEDKTVLDLGIIQTELIGETLFENEKVLLTADFEARLNDKTVSQHQLSANGVTQGKQIPIRIDGEDKFFFKLDQQFFGEDSFQKLTFIINNMIVNVGEGDELRTFEYHTPFTAYLLEFHVRPDEIVAFNENDVAVSVLKNDSNLITCGLSAGDINPEILPPVVSIRANGFEFAVTNPEAGKGAITDPITKEIQKDAEFCQTVPQLPRNTELTFRIGNEFFEVFSPSTQSNFFVKCTDLGCSSNIGFSN